jgi:hypothetical protein
MDINLLQVAAIPGRSEAVYAINVPGIRILKLLFFNNLSANHTAVNK